MNDELKEIKKIYGEEMAHLCRELFPTILDNKGALLKILQSCLAPTRSFASDVREKKLYNAFKDFIYSHYQTKKLEKVKTDKTPFELMDEKGYVLYECHSEEDIQSFKKYYAPNEVICTIYVGGRLDRCHVFFAVKKNVDEIKRERFENPEREDEYGRSVISIQFSRGLVNTLSIKNRYNHTVENPDATYNNDLETIIPGLTYSFEKQYGLHIEHGNEMTSQLFASMNYVRDKSGRYYRCNVEVDGVYYCDNNIIIKDGEVISEYAEDKGRYIVVEQFIVDRHKKEIYLYSNGAYNDMSFIDSINSVGKINNIDILKNGQNRVITIRYEKENDEDESKEVIIEIDKNNTIVRYINDHVKSIGNVFLMYNRNLKEISLNNVIEIGTNFLPWNSVVERVSIPKAKKIGEAFMRRNHNLQSISLPELEKMEKNFLRENKELTYLYAPKVKEIKDQVLKYNCKLKEVSLPEAESLGVGFLYSNNSEEFKVDIPKVRNIYSDVFANIKSIYGGKLTIPNVEEIDDSFLQRVESLEELYMPNVRSIGNDFASSKENSILSLLDVPSLRYTGYYFLEKNKYLKNINCPNLEMVNVGFMIKNQGLEHIYAPNLTDIDYNALMENHQVRKELINQLGTSRSWGRI